ncbi:MAG: MFS transporter [Pseudomonadota bacterium]|nr:MFS transporter [Pseudomonadota bacterium]
MLILLLIVGINFVGVGALIPVLPLTVIENGYPASVMTLLLASYAFAMFVANPILGRLSDYYGRRLVLFISLAVGALAHLWFAFSGDIVTMFLSRIIAGFAAGNTGVIQAMIADRSPPEKRAQYMGLVGAAIGIGFVAGPALGGLLSEVGGGPVHRMPFLLAAGFSFLALLMTFRMKAPQGGRQPTARAAGGMLDRVRDLLRSPLAPYALVSLALNLSFAQVEASFVLVLRDYLEFGPRETGWLFAYVGVCIILFQAFLIRRLVGHMGEVSTVRLGGVVLMISQALTVLLVLGMLPANQTPLVQTLLVTTGICFGYAVATPAISGAVSRLAGASTMGGALGMIQGFGSLGQVAGLVMAGPLYDLGGSQYPFGFGAAVTLGMLVLVPYLARPLRADEAGQ